MRATKPMISVMTCLASCALLLGCSSSDFASSSEKAATPTTANATAATPAPAPSAAPAATPPDGAANDKADAATSAATPATAPATGTTANCNADGSTQATLLTKTVQNDTAGNYLEYNLTVTDCSGKQIPFTAAVLSFDIGASITAQVNLTYTITDAGNSANTMSGTLVDLEGHDLFGNTGSQYYHYETDKAVSFAAAANAIIVHINLGGMSMVPYGTNSATTMNTYLAFGSAATVTTPVTLTGTAATNTLSSILQKSVDLLTETRQKNLKSGLSSPLLHLFLPAISCKNSTWLASYLWPNLAVYGCDKLHIGCAIGRNQ